MLNNLAVSYLVLIHGHFCAQVIEKAFCVLLASPP
jgi:hypothetical protein